MSRVNPAVTEAINTSVAVIVIEAERRGYQRAIDLLQAEVKDYADNGLDHGFRFAVGYLEARRELP